MSELLRKLLAFLRLGAVDGETTPVDPPTDAEPTDDLFDDDLFDDDLITAAEEGGGTPAADPEESPALKEAKRRAEEAEQRAERETRAREEIQRSIPAPRPQADPDFEREEQELAQARNSGATQEQIAWLQWKVDSNRKIRSTERSSTQALQRAEDLADRTAFEHLEITKPQVFKRYAERVEKAVAEMRGKGNTPAPRLAILRLLIGDDIMNGKVKSKPKAAPVERGRTGVVRSDTRGNKGAVSEHEKRKARLQNIRI